MQPKTEAIKLLQEKGINKLPIDPIKIIETLGISIKEHNFKSIEGFSIFDPDGKRSVIGVNSQIKGLSRKNFTYAHELGHFCLDAFTENGNNCQKKDITNTSKGLDQIEINANIFASHLLLPDFLIKKRIKNIDPDWHIISKLAEETKTSLITTASRFIEVTDHICLLAVISQNKLIKYFRKSRNWSLYLDMDGRILSPVSYAYKSCNREHIPDNFESVSADTWLSDTRISFDSELLEWTLPLNSYGEVLTLLWDEEDLLQNSENEATKPIYDKKKIAGVWDPPTFHR